ncbi:MAG: EpsI family protein [Saprospiraceae bacterium]|nr:EpsI family protein [Pyrinomonadaceae bacterium]
MSLAETNLKATWKPFLIGAAVSFLYATVFAKLGRDWWTDENYSHGLLIPFVIGYIVWLEFETLRNTEQKSRVVPGLAIVSFSLSMLLFGTLGAELFTQRVSIAVMLAGIVVYFFGFHILQKLAVPFALLLLAIPVPRIIFSKIALPLQMWATQSAHWSIGLFGISSVRKGNVIEILPRGETQIVGLEVVEACSGIRSLMTLVTLALILGYLTRERRDIISAKWFDFVKDRDFWRTIILFVAAFPIALLTNAARVMTTGILTYYYGRQMAEGVWHEIAGWFVYLAALVILIAFNSLLKRSFFRDGGTVRGVETKTSMTGPSSIISSRQTVALFIVILIGGVFINWFEQRGEIQMERRPLSEIPPQLGAWQQLGADTRFNAPTESILRASDYVMRDYYLADRSLNLYIGYYASQRTGATYHSPQSCLPGSGWEMKDHQLIEIKTAEGGNLTANRYIVQRGDYKEIVIYWYQGRGRTNSNEYMDKVHTILDSILTGRSDGAMVRVMTPVGEDETVSMQAAVDVSAQVRELISPFVPE